MCIKTSILHLYLGLVLGRFSVHRETCRRLIILDFMVSVNIAKTDSYFGASMVCMELSRASVFLCIEDLCVSLKVASDL